MNHLKERSSQDRENEDIAEEEDLIWLYKGEKRFASHKGGEKEYNLGLRKIIHQPP